MPQTQADLAVYVKSLLGQMVRSVDAALQTHAMATHAAAVRMIVLRSQMITLVHHSKHASKECRTAW